MKRIFVLIIFLISLGNYKEKTTKLLIIGDSISIGYFPYLQQELKIYNVLVAHNEGNARDTGNGLNNIKKWIGNNKNWDIIQFNFGLWDLCYRNKDLQDSESLDKINGKLTTSIEKYKENLDSIVQTLKTLTRAKLIYVTTTYVPEGEHGRYSIDAVKYNDAAKEIMKKHLIMVNDIYSQSMLIHNRFGKEANNVHYSNDGYNELGKLILPTLIEEVVKLK